MSFSTSFTYSLTPRTSNLVDSLAMASKQGFTAASLSCRKVVKKLFVCAFVTHTVKILEEARSFEAAVVALATCATTTSQSCLFADSPVVVARAAQQLWGLLFVFSFSKN